MPTMPEITGGAGMGSFAAVKTIPTSEPVTRAKNISDIIEGLEFVSLKYMT